MGSIALVFIADLFFLRKKLEMFDSLFITFIRVLNCSVY